MKENGRFIYVKFISKILIFELKVIYILGYKYLIWWSLYCKEWRFDKEEY